MQVSKEQIESFLQGSHEMEHIIKIECDYDSEYVYVIYRGEDGKKKIEKDYFYPFVWCKQSVGRKLFNGDRQKLRDMMALYGIACKGLTVENSKGITPERMQNGYRVMFYAKVAMTYTKFMEFFTKGGVPIYPKQGDSNYGMKEYIAIAPIEQYMTYTGKRIFKGYDSYDDVLRLEWDLETEGLDPTKDAISQIGVRTNKGFEKIITIVGEGEERKRNEINAILDFFQIIKDIEPDVICGHNTENFDWPFIDTRLKVYGSNLLEVSKEFFPKGVYKKNKQAVLKLGGEMEYYFPTIMWGTNITDSLHAVRRAMALDSSMKKADLKYATKYAKLNKPNRVYVPGKIINTTWEDTSKSYAFNNKNGKWFKIEEKHKEKYTITENEVIDNNNNDHYEIVTGRYIVERYLLDDLYETDKVELRFNESNFLVGKMLPVAFDKMCTMGTAAIWKYIMLAWSYEHDLAIPELIPQRPFTGGLSRLLKVGYVGNVVKLDYNSLYPSIILTYGIKTDIDLMDTMSAMLEYILTQREHYKELKAVYKGKANAIKEQIPLMTDAVEIEEAKKKYKEFDMLAARNDKMQLPLKITGNAFFGSYGSGSVFPFSDITCAEETTCIGRQALRLMIYHFTNLGYTPIVGDSFTGDTPLFIKYNDTNLIDIKPISELIEESEIKTDMLGREYDYSKKNYKVLCRSGWCDPSYIYRHKTDKPIYEVSEDDMKIEVTEDHSLLDENQVKIKPSEITSDTKLEYYDMSSIYTSFNTLTIEECKKVLNQYDFVVSLLNANVDVKKMWYEVYKNKVCHTKTEQAVLNFVKNCL